jgi:hypothetical protein
VTPIDSLEALARPHFPWAPVGLLLRHRMPQAAAGDGLSFDLPPLDQDGLAPAEVDVSRREIAKALVVAGVVVVLDKG